MVICYIGIGSNLGERQYYIEAAIKKIKTVSSTKVTKVSRIIKSLPQGGPLQNYFFNGVIEIETGLSPYQLLEELQNIEASLGRIRTVKNYPRTIDLDILTFGDVLMQEEALTIPHPRILERDFVLEPLKEIASEAVRKSLFSPRKSKSQML